jgi:6-phosphofructokinase
MVIKNALYAQSGGVTAVINTTACGVIETARTQNTIGKLFAGRNGILGILEEDLIDTSLEADEAIRSLYHTPGGAFGSCRYKLKGLEENKAEYERLLNIFEAHNIGYFFYNGGGDSQDTAYKISQLSEKMGYPLTCIGIPKTIDNDLPFTDSCPGFGSVAKYVAVSIREAGLDVASMASTSTKVFILEVMGRHAGWIAAASGLASETEAEPPHIILFPEIPFDEKLLCQRVQETVERFGYCVIVVSEGVKDQHGQFLSELGQKDAFGHVQLGGVAPRVAGIIKKNLGYKYHWAVSDYLQRSARHIASKVDVEQAYALGRAAVLSAVQGKNAIMPIIVRESASPYQWHIGEVPLKEVANQERKLPREYISNDGFSITTACREYMFPLIQGEAYPPYQSGLPAYITLSNISVPQVLPPFSVKK